MKVLHNSRWRRLKDSDRLGSGGEAVVYRVGDDALKIFHPPQHKPRTAEGKRERQLLQEKLQKVAAFPTGLPNNVLTPTSMVVDEKQHAVGYAMPLLQGAQELARLRTRRGQQQLSSSNALLQLFRNLHATVSSLHAHGVVIGDFNDANVLFVDDNVYLIDADSMQFSTSGHTYVCRVGHERFLDPKLYGVDLASTSTTSPALNVDSDWYAFNVLLLQSLLWVHPYGGVHPAHPTLLRRAEARVSIFDGDVKLPKAARPLRCLPSALADFFCAVFESDARQPFDVSLLPSTFSTCSRCQQESLSTTCPTCTTSTSVHVASPATLTTGVDVREAFVTNGVVLDVVIDRGLRVLHTDGERLLREDGRVVAEGRWPSTLRTALDHMNTVLMADGQAIVLDKNGKTTAHSADITPWGVTQATYADGKLLVARAERIVDVDEGTHFVAGLERQTELFAGGGKVVGHYVVGKKHLAFVHGVHGTFDIELDAVRGKLLDVGVAFDAAPDGCVWLSCLWRSAGHDEVEGVLFDAHGVVHARHRRRVVDDAVIGSMGKPAVVGRRLLFADDDALVLMEPSQIGLHIRRRISVPEGAVHLGMDVVTGPTGSVFAISEQRVLQLSLPPS